MGKKKQVKLGTKDEKESGAEHQQSNAKKTTAGCIVPEGCLVGTPISKPPLPDAVKVICSNPNCTQTLYLHPNCYDKWEESLIDLARRAGGGSKGHRPRDWSLRELQAGLWKSGIGGSYRFVVTACVCPCGGHLCKDLDYDFVKEQTARDEANEKLVAAKAAAKAKKPLAVYPRCNLGKNMPGMVASNLMARTAASGATNAVKKIPEAKHFWDDMTVEKKPAPEVKKKQTQKRKKNNSELESVEFWDQQSGGTGTSDKVSKDSEHGSFIDDQDDHENNTVHEEDEESAESEADRLSALYTKYDLGTHTVLCVLTGKEYKAEGDLLEMLANQL